MNRAREVLQQAWLHSRFEHLHHAQLCIWWLQHLHRGKGARERLLAADSFARLLPALEDHGVNPSELNPASLMEYRIGRSLPLLEWLEGTYKDLVSASHPRLPAAHQCILQETAEVWRTRGVHLPGVAP